MIFFASQNIPSAANSSGYCGRGTIQDGVCSGEVGVSLPGKTRRATQETSFNVYSKCKTFLFGFALVLK